jgi:hypothetical protein
MAHINKKLLLLICILLFIVSIFVVYANKESAIQLPLPTYTCNSKLNWHGLIPGQSNRDDVLNTLGEPTTRGRFKYEDSNISYFAYKVNGGEISKYTMDRIFFRSNGIVDWMEIAAADSNSGFTSLFDTVLQLGSNVDVIYTNNNYRPSNNFIDVLFEPDRIYVWSECGLALDVLPSTYSPLLQVNQKECNTDEERIKSDMCNIIPRHPTPYNFIDEPEPDVNSLVLMKFYFQPTSYNAFAQYYMYKIPYGMWNKFLDTYR